MAPTDSTAGRPAGLVRFVALLHRYFLPALLAVYFLSAVAPRPGAFIREFEVTLPGGIHERASMLLLAVLLFCAAAVIQWPQIHGLIDRPSILLFGLLTAWLGPALLVALFSGMLPWLATNETTSGMLVGFALVAAMPVANSSAGWTQNAGGNVAISLALIVLSIILSPLATPNLLKLMGWALSAEDTRRIETVVTQFSGWRFILWVILPSLAGAVAAWGAGRERIVRAKPWFRLVTLATILVLNYANASLAMDQVWANESAVVVLVAAGMALTVSLIGMALATLQSRLSRLTRAAWTALAFSLSMKHTGLALVIAGEFLHDQPRVILMVLLTTLAQHVAAAALDWRLEQTRLAHAPPGGAHDPLQSL
jgi:BASS family bile acid:Na+ symporter